MHQLVIFKDMLERYSKHPVDFLVVYIEEAHPLDGWSLDSNQFKLQKPKHMKERVQAAEMFVEHAKVDCPIVVDGMENEANNAYGALPERLYIILNGNIAYEGGKGPLLYDLNELELALKKIISV
ncbi:unnamed protein product [Clavelina lepadiformis]|uniref:Iodothyronine deiodinase n=1 Tax=Clavelina lepadiformis TaxID=159417 RepID=A0ABP0F0G8_CLALP